MRYDVIVIGGGHNGLTAAGLLARRGHRVLVCEARAVLGGLAAGDEFAPGYRTVGVLHDAGRLHPRVVKQLALEQHGLSRRAAPAAVLAPERDGPGLVLHGDAARMHKELAARAPADAQRWPAFRTFADTAGGFLRTLCDAPPPPIAPRGPGDLLGLLRTGLGLRRLGEKTMYELLRVLPMCVADWLEDWFTDAHLAAVLAAPALLGTWCGPWSAGTAALWLFDDCTRGGDVDGGPAQIAEALRRACVQARVELRTDAEVLRIVVERGRVRGVELAGAPGGAGRTVVEADVVVSSLDPKRTFLGLLAPTDLPPGLDRGIASWRCRGTTAKVDLALDGPLEFACRPGEAFEAARVCEDLEELERAFDPVKYRSLPERPHLDVRVPTIRDPSLAPPGHHVASILVHFVPHDLDGGFDARARSTLLERTLARLGEVAPSVKDRIVAHRVTTPADLERELGISGGHVHHGEHALDQWLMLRPHHLAARYGTPLTGLFLCGSSSHPGGGITGAPGMLAAAAIG